MTNFKSKTQGFTLIELIVVIVILGIMTAIAVPKFVDLQSEARISVMQGVEGAVRGAATLVYSKSLIEGEESINESATPSVDIQSGVTVTTHFGYPNAGVTATPVVTGIVNAVDLQGEVVATTNGATVTFTYGSLTTCTLTYAESASAGAAPVITNNANSTNC